MFYVYFKYLFLYIYTLDQYTSTRVLSRVRQIIPAGGGDVIAEYKSFASPNSKRIMKNRHELRLRRFVVFGGERVPMTKNDQIETRKASNANKEFASIILLGFKPKDRIPFFHTLEQSYFVYPTPDDTSDDKRYNRAKNKGDSSGVSGGCDAFAHLHASMIRKGVVAIGELLTRVTATSRLVVMWPTGGSANNNYYNDNVVSSSGCDNFMSDDGLPPGLAMASLPFEDEVRLQEPDIATETWDNTHTDVASEELICSTMELIQRQTLTGAAIGENFDNANLLQFWDYVEHIALAEPIQPEDCYHKYDTVINKAEVRKAFGAQIDQIKSLLPDDIIPEKKPSIRQRKREPDDSGIDWEMMYSENRISDCRVPDLKKKLRSIGETVSGNKQEVRIFYDRSCRVDWPPHF